MNFTENFRQAVEDYAHFLNKKYPQKSLLELVGTRYSLNQHERSMLFRGITTIEKASIRNKRLVDPEKVRGEILHIDLYNALFTIAAYLRGYPVYLALDGLLRDASESHGCSDWIEQLDKGLELKLQYFIETKPARVIFYLDNLLEHCRKVVEKIHQHCKRTGMDHEIILHDSPDHLLENATVGLLASSDSTIIDRSELPVLDLPRAILEFHYEPRFYSLGEGLT